jgi:hypothetical protein
MPRFALALLLALHGAIHLLGFAKGMALADVEALKQPISRVGGALWLAAAVLFLSAAVLLLAAPGRWWIPAVPALLLSQGLIVGAWSDARFGTLANLVILVPLAVTLLGMAPWSLAAEYGREVAMRPAAPAAAPDDLVTEADLAPLPAPVRQYLRRAGVVGRPHVRGFQARFRGRIRNGIDAPWMDFVAVQRTVVDPPSRLFLIDAARAGIPFQALHRFVGSQATMRVRVAQLVEVVNARGPEMNRSETVTFFNDLCILAPGALVDVPIRWEALDSTSVRATYTHGSQTVSAVLTFDARGDLAGFVSEDRYMSSDGKTYVKHPWSTPVGDPRDYAGGRLARTGAAIWKLPGRDFTYGEFVLESLTTDPAPARSAAPARSSFWSASGSSTTNPSR